ncbi:hypothetical protein TrLO_g2360 [Triparma laevis f. longispina]|uniref:Maleylacetoacetate isomerase n=2 Tax=Triparma laevis TaxID=1534972 RepID=A0A9W7FDE6_9STRA|nr:hypothetical protein TrLO_g2360 [Triparma laevis f. longispina]
MSSNPRFKDFKLYGYWRSSSSWRVRTKLTASNITYKTISKHLVKGEQKEGEYAANVNGMKQVPSLQFFDTKKNSTVTLTQSLAIIKFLASAYPGTLEPSDPVDVGFVEMISEIINSGIQPLQNFSTCKEITQGSNDAMNGREWGAGKIKVGLDEIERLVAARYEGGEAASNSDFCTGPGTSPTVADACLVPQLYNARRFNVNVEDYTTLMRVEKACKEHEWFKASHPDMQPDAVVGAPAAAAAEPTAKKQKTN